MFLMTKAVAACRESTTRNQNAFVSVQPAGEHTTISSRQRSKSNNKHMDLPMRVSDAGMRNEESLAKRVDVQISLRHT